MSWTPAAELARLKVTYTGWLISRTGGQVAAVRRTGKKVRLTAQSVPDLERLLIACEMGRPVR